MAAISRSARCAPLLVAGEQREPDEVLCRDAVVVGRGVVGGGGGPHHEAFGVGGGEIIECRRWRSRGRARAARRAPFPDRRPARSPRRARARRGSSRRNRTRGRGIRAGLRARNGRAGRRASSCAAMKSNARAAMSSQICSPNTRPALASAAIISPFQSASTLSSSPGRTRVARAARSFARNAAERVFVLRRCAGCGLRRLRMLWPSKLPDGSRRSGARRNSPSSMPRLFDHFVVATRRRTCPLRPRNPHRATPRTRPPRSSSRAASHATVSYARAR